MELLAGDIGGTKTLLLRGRWQRGRLQVLARQRFASAAYADLADMVREFLRGVPLPARACFAVAGPVQPVADGGAQARITNLPWELDSRRLAQGTGIGEVFLINDLAGVAHGVAMLQAADVVTVQAGAEQPGRLRAVLGIGTGLGMALLSPGGEVFPTEAGHLAFAPLDDRQGQLRAFVRHKLGLERVSVERLVAGPGLALVHEFLGGGVVDPGDIAALADAGDGPAGESMALFMTLCGAIVGDLALACLPFGGLYLAGGVMQKNRARVAGPDFRRAFAAKGRMAGVLRQLPLHVITEPQVGLLGAARYAALAEDRAG